MKRRSILILTTTFVMLLQELILIRWLPSQVRVVSYFPNLILIGAFLGLGIGCLLASRRSLLTFWPLLFALPVVCGWTFSHFVISTRDPSEHLWLLYWGFGPDSPTINDIRLPLLLIFTLSSASFVPIGQNLAKLLNEYRAEGKLLRGYCLDIVGSLAGILVFTLLGFSGLFPWTWFALLFLCAIPLFTYSKAALLRLSLCSALLLTLVIHAERDHFYSPYYALRLDRMDETNAIAVLTNGSLHQRIQSMRPAETTSYPQSDSERMIEGYHRPYRSLKSPPRKVLVVGAGNGNDVSVALQHNAEEVHAVEIDPQIIAIGKQHHPDRPYDSFKVKPAITDARTFLNETKESYDLIVFATLDSMTKLSALSNVRLDNFVYTRECLQAAARHLNPGGGIVLNFWVGKEHIHHKILTILEELFPNKVTVIQKEYLMFNVAYFVGDAFSHLTSNGKDQFRVRAAAVRDLLSPRVIPDDDWPYLYLQKRGVSTFYLQVIGAILILSLISIFAVSPAMRQSVATGRGMDIEMFLFGAGFLLLETRGVTAMSLAWGATWLTSSVVFASILLMVLASTLYSMRYRVRVEWAILGLLLTLLAAYLMPAEYLLSSSVGLRFLLSLVVVGLPVFFSGLCFSARFALREHADIAFGWNLLGAVAGGLLEFLSMGLGLRALLLVAMLCYLLVLLIKVRENVSIRRAPAIAKGDPATLSPGL